MPFKLSFRTQKPVTKQYDHFKELTTELGEQGGTKVLRAGSHNGELLYKRDPAAKKWSRRWLLPRLWTRIREAGRTKWVTLAQRAGTKNRWGRQGALKLLSKSYEAHVAKQILEEFKSAYNKDLEVSEMSDGDLYDLGQIEDYVVRNNFLQEAAKAGLVSASPPLKTVQKVMASNPKSEIGKVRSPQEHIKRANNGWNLAAMKIPVSIKSSCFAGNHRILALQFKEINDLMPPLIAAINEKGTNCENIEKIDNVPIAEYVQRIEHEFAKIESLVSKYEDDVVKGFGQTTVGLKESLDSIKQLFGLAEQKKRSEQI